MNQPKGVHLVGSIPLSNADTVFETACSILGQHLQRVPDGETGERSNWINWQLPLMMNMPIFDTIPPAPDRYPPIPQVKVRQGISQEELEFGALGYSQSALSSYDKFVQLKQEGTIPAECKFQICLPTPLAPVAVFVVPEDQANVEASYEARLLAELDEILTVIPHTEVAIQWDTAVEFALWEGIWPTHFTDVKAGIIERLLKLGNYVPATVEMGYHLCYGDSQHKHFVEPKDMANLVEVANALFTGVERPINWIHMPVPRDRTDKAFFAPLKNLSLPSETELYLGLVHFTDGVAGAQQRIEAAQQVISDFGVATECGFGRRAEETIPDLMRLHAKMANPQR